VRSTPINHNKIGNRADFRRRVKLQRVKREEAMVSATQTPPENAPTPALNGELCEHGMPTPLPIPKGKGRTIWEMPLPKTDAIYDKFGIEPVDNLWQKIQNYYKVEGDTSWFGETCNDALKCRKVCGDTTFYFWQHYYELYEYLVKKRLTKLDIRCFGYNYDATLNRLTACVASLKQMHVALVKLSALPYQMVMGWDVVGASGEPGVSGTGGRLSVVSGMSGTGNADEACIGYELVNGVDQYFIFRSLVTDYKESFRAMQRNVVRFREIKADFDERVDRWRRVRRLCKQYGVEFDGREPYAPLWKSPLFIDVLRDVMATIKSMVTGKPKKVPKKRKKHLTPKLGFRKWEQKLNNELNAGREVKKAMGVA